MFKSIVLSLAVANAWPWNGGTETTPNGEGLHHHPNLAAVIEALQNPHVYEELTRHQPCHRDSEWQSPIKSVFRDDKDSTYGARTGFPAYDGETPGINGREYKLYCYNAPWDSYVWLPKSKILDECESKCHSRNYDCNGLTFYPLTGACSIIYSTDARPYICDNVDSKIRAIPVKSRVAFGPGELCQLPGSDDQVGDFDEDKSGDYRFKVSCKNQIMAD